MINNSQPDISYPSRIQKYRVFLFLLVLTAFLLRFWNINAEYGYSDEAVYAGLGKVYWKHFLGYGTTFWEMGSEHPPVAKYLYGMASSIYPEGHYLLPRILSAILGAFSCLLVVLIGTRLINYSVGFMGGIILCFLPQYIAHTRIAGLESPSVFFSLLSIWFILKYSIERKIIFYILSAVSMGLLFGIRFNNILLCIPVLYLLWDVALSKEKANDSNPTGSYTQNSLLFIIYLLIAMVIFYLSWHKIWFNPLNEILQSYFFDSLNETNMRYFLGTKQSPRFYYFPVYLAVTFPGLLLIPFIIGLVKARDYMDKKSLIFLLLFLLSPLLISFTGFRREGVRYVLIAYPAMAIFTSLGIYHVSNWLFLKFKIRRSINIVSIFGIFYLMIIYLLVHPHELEYYNEWVGGPGRVYKNRWFEMGHWGDGISAGMSKVNRLTDKDISLDIRLKPFHEIPIPQRTDIVYQKSPNAKYILMNTEYEWYYSDESILKNYQLMDTVSVMGAPIVKLFRNKSESSDTLLPLERKDWSVIASHQPGRGIFALDNNIITRWTSMKAQEPGMYFQVDMGTIQKIKGIALVTWTSPSAWPVGYQIEVSKDGNQWITVTENPSTKSEDLVFEIFFQPSVARYIKITQTGSSRIFGWAIHEFYVYPDSNQSLDG